MSADPHSDDYSLVESLWEAAAEVMHVDPASQWDKAVFYAGIKSAIMAIDQLLPCGNPPPEVSIAAMLTDVDRFFIQLQQTLEQAEEARLS